MLAESVIWIQQVHICCGCMLRQLYDLQCGARVFVHWLQQRFAYSNSSLLSCTQLLLFSFWNELHLSKWLFLDAHCQYWPERCIQEEKTYCHLIHTKGPNKTSSTSKYYQALGYDVHPFSLTTHRTQGHSTNHSLSLRKYLTIEYTSNASFVSCSSMV